MTGRPRREAAVTVWRFWSRSAKRARGIPAGRRAPSKPVVAAGVLSWRAAYSPTRAANAHAAIVAATMRARVTTREGRHPGGRQDPAAPSLYFLKYESRQVLGRIGNRVPE